MDAFGKTGSIHLSEGAVTVCRKGTVRWRRTVSASEKRIPLNQILAVHMTRATALGGGCVEFVVNGWARGENAIFFTHRQQDAFDRLTQAVNAMLAERSRLGAA
jgi:hypothetical protein